MTPLTDVKFGLDFETFIYVKEEQNKKAFALTFDTFGPKLKTLSPVWLNAWLSIFVRLLVSF